MFGMVLVDCRFTNAHSVTCFNATKDMYVVNTSLTVLKMFFCYLLTLCLSWSKVFLIAGVKLLTM